MGRTKIRATARRAAAAEIIRTHERQERRRKLFIYGIGALALAGIVIPTGILLVGAQQQKAAIHTAAGKTIAGVQTFSNLTRNHLASPGPFAQDPPVGGDHSPIWVNCGIYTQPINDGRAVHSLEHGAVWVTYSPSLPSAQVQALATQAKAQKYELLSPRDGLPTPIVASAWGLQLQISDASDIRLAAFLGKYQQGPQTPEPGAACSGAATN
jgi:hypothetical protein